ncbi:dihydropteroate synthase [Helicobacter didelphidarum]|uniref:dihydropteroate synthase n=1 Tax=Helicobacter didelphidarum TaxID=2040648 RepID=A0A3D8INF8_9HELI|nr:dihydropteroate synthase [Helicobacter didelphidarum]RDU66111.1 dihydropteroate synthase [Helicobacter didelphidarum]
MRLERIKNLNIEMLQAKPDSIGYKIMKDKTQVLGFNIANLKLQAMQILKQEALSIGAELVTPRDAILCRKKAYDCMLFGTPKALKLLVIKIQMQPFGLKALGKELKHFLKPYHERKKMIMSVVNVDSQSFYKHFNATDAIQEIYRNIELGADIIDIGAVSTQPNAPFIEAKVELKRLEPIFKEITTINNKPQFSIDTYNKEVAKIALECGFTMINDVSGKPENMLEILQQYPNATYILTHTRGGPNTMHKYCEYKNLILDIDKFFTEQLRMLDKHSCKNIILDVGIGFAKTFEQNIELIAKLAHFKHFHKPLLIGASHKSFLRKILKSDNKKQLEASLIAHFIALQNGADIIRVHDLESHQIMLQLYHSFQMNDLDIL